jgi:hypothetical protein
MRRCHIKTYWEDADDKEHAIRVEFTLLPGCRGARDSLCGVRGAGPPLEPDEDPEIEITSITLAATGEEIEPSDKDTNRIIDECWDYVAEMSEPEERE